jgi:phage repressor protein C with HTH and peptisase S24 domain
MLMLLTLDVRPDALTPGTMGTVPRRRYLLPWQRVRVNGPSMVPTLRHGDAVLARHGARIRPGDVVLGQFRDMPGRYVLKRAVEADGDGWQLRSDNDLVEGDSRQHGTADVLARVLLVWPGGRRGRRRWVPRRVR